MSEHVVSELLAYLDGELDLRERALVEAHLAACTDCAAELDRLRVLQLELGATFDAALTPLRLPAAADRRIRQRLRACTGRRSLGVLWQRRGLFAQAALALLVAMLALFTFQPFAEITGTAVEIGAQETLVLGQDHLAPGSQAALRVVVRDAALARPLEDAEVVVRLGRTPGVASIVYRGRTDASGSASVTFAVPEDLIGQASLVVETSSPGGTDRIVRPITIARADRLLLASDKPAYRPGQTVHLRALVLSAVDMRPAAGQEISFTVFDPAGRQVSQGLAFLSDYGVASFDFDLPASADLGRYTLRAQVGETISERAVTVGEYELPAFQVAVETGRAYYGPGERVEGSVEAAYFFGRPIAEAEVILSGYAQDAARTLLLQVAGRTDDEGRFDFALDLPVGYPPATGEATIGLDLEAAVTDAAGQQAGVRQVLPIAVQPIVVRAIPESGVLKPGVENVLFILTAYPDGSAAETTLQVTVAGETYNLVSGPYGLATFRFVPAVGTTRFDVRAQDAQGTVGTASLAFQSDAVAQTLLLRAEQAAYEVGDTLRLEALVAGEIDTVYLDVVHARQAVAAFTAPVEDGRAVFALDLDGAMVGTLELHAYAILADGGTVDDTRLVIVDAPRQVAVAVRADQETYSPGETARIEIETTLSDPAGQPVRAALGVGVVDASVYALETQPPGFVRAYFLLEQALLSPQPVAGFDEVTLLEAEAELLAAQDVAARAAWAGAAGTGFTLSAQSVVEPAAPELVRPGLSLPTVLGILEVLLPFLLCGVVLQGLRASGVLGRAWRRVGVGGMILLVASPIVACVGGAAMWLAWALLGPWAPLAVLVLIILLWAGLAVHGWVRRDARVQLASGLLATYLALGGLLVYLAARGGDPQGLLLALIAAAFLLIVAAVAALGQGLVLEGWRAAGWAATAISLLLVVLAIYLPFVPNLASNLTRTVGSPALYAGPVGWVSGCQPAPEPMPEPTEEPEGVEEEPTAEPTEEPTEAPTEAPPSIEVTATPAPTPTPAATAVPLVGGEPFPLRQVFPETLYWNPELLTDEGGALAFDLPLADSVTTWRLTALASTQAGELGFASYDLRVRRDLFVDLELPAVITQGQAITVTAVVYNDLEQAQPAQVTLTPASWYTLLSAPVQSLDLAPGEVAAVVFSIRAEEPGAFSLQAVAEGEASADAVAVAVTVTPIAEEE